MNKRSQSIKTWLASILVTLGINTISSAESERVRVVLPEKIGNWTTIDRKGIGDKIINGFYHYTNKGFDYYIASVGRGAKEIDRGVTDCFFGADKEAFKNFIKREAIESASVKTEKWRYITPKNQQTISNYADLKGKTLVKLIGHPFIFQNKEINSNVFKSVESVAGESIVLKMVARKRVDVGLISEAQIKEEANVSFNQSIVAYTVDRRLTCIAGNPASAKLISQFNQFLIDRKLINLSDK